MTWVLESVTVSVNLLLLDSSYAYLRKKRHPIGYPRVSKIVNLSLIWHLVKINSIRISHFMKCFISIKL